MSDLRRDVCPRCGGSGEVHHHPTSVSPFSGVQVIDPQKVVDEECPTCGGEGVVADRRAA